MIYWTQRIAPGLFLLVCRVCGSRCTLWRPWRFKTVALYKRRMMMDEEEEVGPCLRVTRNVPSRLRDRRPRERFLLYLVQYFCKRKTTTRKKVVGCGGLKKKRKTSIDRPLCYKRYNLNKGGWTATSPLLFLKLGSFSRQNLCLAENVFFFVLFLSRKKKKRNQNHRYEMFVIITFWLLL